MKLKTLFSFFIILLVMGLQEAQASSRMRKCLLLPITDNIGGAVAFDVFKGVERRLKNGRWCYYQSNSDLINIFSNYRKNLETYLQSSEVIGLAAERTGSGSIIRVNLVSDVKGVWIELDVFGENGRDRYFHEKTKIENEQTELIVQTIDNWLEVYSKKIPFDGTVISVLGNQVTIDIGKASLVKDGMGIEIKRPGDKKYHPLLKEIVEWDSQKVAEGNIQKVSEFQAFAVLTVYFDNLKPQKGDWVVLKKNFERMRIDETTSSEARANSFGKLGVADLSIILGKSDVTSVVGDENKGLSGLQYGVALGINLWITRNYWVATELAKSISSVSKSEGDLEKNDNSTDPSVFKLYGGYKFLPLGFFYGPQLDLYAGYSSYSYGLSKVPADGMIKSRYNGIMVGFNANAPLVANTRAFLQLEAIIGTKYAEDSHVHGTEKSASSYQIEAGANYSISPILGFKGSIEFISNKATFADTELYFKETLLKAGVSYQF